MREKIIQKAAEQFLSYGFKSVTMDDIANAMAISKKTIYTHFKTKNKLVEAATNYLFEHIHEGIEQIRAQKKNPIAELFEIKQFAMQHLKGEASSPQYQLQKYYPRIYESIKERQFSLVECCLTENIKRGVATGDYRKDVPVDFAARMHFAGTQAINDRNLFEGYAIHELKDLFLEYHIRAIASPQGLQTLQELLHQK